ncbi:hypothetical protein CPT_Machias_262 [Staphylococcus phage Machias]|nr:hypothetical protein CPT_Machias_262 [Staphylococcus phage Machias]
MSIFMFILIGLLFITFLCGIILMIRNPMFIWRDVDYGTHGFWYKSFMGFNVKSSLGIMISLASIVLSYLVWSLFFKDSFIAIVLSIMLLIILIASSRSSISEYHEDKSKIY